MANQPEDVNRDLASRLLGIDPRSLALCRISLALLLLYDILARAADLGAMYTDGGVMPAAMIRQQYAEQWRWSLHWLSGSWSAQAILFGLAAVCALALLVGFQTRLATIGSWILLTSLHNHAPLVINGGDTLMRLLVFWGMFLPLGAAWSWDSMRSSDRQLMDRPIFSVATAAILLQVCLVYWFTAIYKLIEGWSSGPGLDNALAWGGYNKPLGEFLLGYPEAMKALSLATLGLELVGPFLLFVPRGTRYWRMAVIVAFVAFHVGIEISIYVGLFSFVSLAAWTLFLPREFWDRVTRRTVQPKNAVDEGAATVSSPAPWAARAASWLCLALLVYVVVFNVMGVLIRLNHMETYPHAIKRIAQLTMIRQQWSMFAKPVPFSSWFVTEANLRDGTTVDVMRGGDPVVTERPERIALIYPNHRWRKFYQATTMKNYRKFAQPAADYLFRNWNQSHVDEQQIKTLNLICTIGPLLPVGDETAEDEYKSFTFAQVQSGEVPIEDTINFDVP